VSEQQQCGAALNRLLPACLPVCCCSFPRTSVRLPWSLPCAVCRGTLAARLHARAAANLAAVRALNPLQRSPLPLLCRSNDWGVHVIEGWKHTARA
jgi:hypothetical protein